MGRLLGRLLCTVVLAIGVLAEGCGGGDEVTWKRVSSTEGSFSILMPGTPIERSQTEITDFGPVDFAQFLFESADGTEYVVMYADMPEELFEVFAPDEMLDAFAPRIVQKTSGELIHELVVRVDGHEGREVKVRTADGLITKMRGYLVGKRNYQVGVVTSPERQFSPDVQKFLDSFELDFSAD